jgi:hypothetical protein
MNDDYPNAGIGGLIIGAVFLITMLFLVSAMLQGCARHQWPEIGEGVRVEKVTIRECKRGEC